MTVKIKFSPKVDEPHQRNPNSLWQIRVTQLARKNGGTLQEDIKNIFNLDLFNVLMFNYLFNLYIFDICFLVVLPTVILSPISSLKSFAFIKSSGVSGISSLRKKPGN
jgi:hypothetical protein